MRQRIRSAGRRVAFTVIELLVVIAIIGVLVGLSAAAYFRFIATQQQNNTESSIRTVYPVLQRQVNAVIKQANTQTIPQSVLTMAQGGRRSADRARIIWKKLRLKQEFPTTFAEALAPWKAANAMYNLPSADLPAKSVYTRALASAQSGAGDSSALLLLSLQQDRKVGKNGLLSPDSLPANSVLDTNNDNVKEIVDGWGVPLAFYRWPTSPDLNALNPGKNKRSQDPLDPDGLLLDPGWYGSVGRLQFESLCHQVSPDGGTTAWYTIVVLVSAGADNVLGLDPTTMAVTAAGNTPDNIYSYQVMSLGGKGGVVP